MGSVAASQTAVVRLGTPGLAHRKLAKTRAARSEARSAESKGGKSELRRAVRRITPGQGDLKDSGTENIPLRMAGLKACTTPVEVVQAFRPAVGSKGEKVR